MPHAGAVSHPSVAAAPFQQTVRLGELKQGDGPALRARLLPGEIVPMIVEGWVGRPSHSAPGSWGVEWGEAALPHNADFCRKRTHRRSLFSLEAGKADATDETLLDIGELYSSDGFAYVGAQVATAQHCAGRTSFFQSPENRRSADFDMVRRLSELIEQAQGPGQFDFRIVCDQKEPAVSCADKPRDAFAGLDVSRIYSIDYPMAYRTISETRAASGRMVRLRQATGPENNRWDTPTFRIAGTDPSASPRLVWQATLAVTPQGGTEVRLGNYFVIR